PMIVGLVALSVALSAAFFWWLARAPEPFLPIPVLKNPVMRMGTAATSFAMSASIGLTIFVPLYFELVHQLSASDSGLALIPLAALTTPGTVVSGQVMMRRQRYKWVPIVMLLVAIAGLALLIWRPALPLVVVVGFGVAPERGTRAASSMTAATVGGMGEHAEHVFSMVFMAAAVCLALAL